MSLGGIAIAIGAMVDAAVVMIENAHKHLERWRDAHPPAARLARGALARDRRRGGRGRARRSSSRCSSSRCRSSRCSRSRRRKGRLFAPLAYTKTYAMAAAAGLAVTLVPVLMGYLIRGRIPAEERNPINRALIARLPAAARGGAALPARDARGRRAGGRREPLAGDAQLGGEFMPPLDEGDLLYMPSALPGISAAKAARAAAADRPPDQHACRRWSACSARSGAPRPRPTPRRSRCSRPRSSSSRASSGAPA